MSEEGEALALTSRPEASQHFRVDSTAISYRELWELHKAGFPILAVLKLLRIRFPSAVLVPLSNSLGRLRWESLPERGRKRVQTIVDVLRPLGFSPVLIYAEDWRGIGLDAFSVALLDEERTTMALVGYTGFQRNDGRTMGEHVDCAFHSRMFDGRILLTASSKYRMRGPSEYEALRLPELPPAEIAQRHAARMFEFRSRTQPYREAEPFIAVEPDEVEEWILALSKREVEFQAERGVFVPASTEDLARFEKPAPPAKRREPAHVLVVWVVVILLVLLLANL